MLESVADMKDRLFLRPLTPADADLHLAGEDEQQVRWFGGRPSTRENVLAFIERMQRARDEGRALWNFGVWDGWTEQLVGNVEGNAESDIDGVGIGEANISYVIFPAWRRRGLAVEAVSLMCEFLRGKGIERAVIRVDPENVASIRVAERTGFTRTGMIETDEGPMVRFVYALRRGL